MKSNTAWYRSAMPEHCLETLVNHAKTPSDFVATTWSIVARDPFEIANHNGYQLLRELPRARVANCCAFTRTGYVSFPFCFANSPSAYRRPRMPKNLCRTSRQSYDPLHGNQVGPSTIAIEGLHGRVAEPQTDILTIRDRFGEIRWKMPRLTKIRTKTPHCAAWLHCTRRVFTCRSMSADRFGWASPEILRRLTRASHWCSSGRPLAGIAAR